MSGKILAILSIEWFAQVSAIGHDSIIERYGISGLVILYFIARDYRQEKRDEAHRDARTKIEDARYDNLVQTISGLVRVTSIEVMSRPNVAERCKAETDEILKRLPPRQ